jgi:hypothetical protein
MCITFIYFFLQKMNKIVMCQRYETLETQHQILEEQGSGNIFSKDISINLGILDIRRDVVGHRHLMTEEQNFGIKPIEDEEGISFQHSHKEGCRRTKSGCMPTFGGGAKLRSQREIFPSTDVCHSSSSSISLDPFSTIKSIYLPHCRKEDFIITERHIPKPRVITTSKEWIYQDDDLHPNVQVQYITSSPTFVKKLIQQKIAGYKCQDVQKQLYCSNTFVTFPYVLQLLQHAVMKNIIGCYYCQEPVLLLYKHVRDPKQWTLERLDNSLGHNCGNVVIACLLCNVKRRVMHHERYTHTKRMSSIVRLDYEPETKCNSEQTSESTETK